MALDIWCRNCTQQEVVNEKQNEAYCKHYNAEIAIDKHLDNCPGGVFIVQPETKRFDPIAETEALNFDLLQKRVAELAKGMGILGENIDTEIEKGKKDQKVLDGKIFDTGKRLDEMELKFNAVLKAVKSLSGAEKVAAIHPAPLTGTTQKTPPGSAERPVRRKAKKKGSKKKVDAKK